MTDMTLEGAKDEDLSFKILRLRLLRPPPAVLIFGEAASKRRPVSVPITLALGITDDYGVDYDQFGSLDLNVEVVSCDEALNPLQGIRLQLAGQESGSSMITIHGHSGPYYTLKGHIIISTATVPSSVKIALSLRQQQQQIQPRALSSTSQAMLKLIGEDGQTPLRGWDDQDYIFMRALSGEVQIKRTSDKSPPTASSEKVQIIERRIHLPNVSRPLVVVERPGLNNSTGQRLWDSAIGMSCWLSLQPQTRNGVFDFGRDDTDIPPLTKRARPHLRRQVVLELGAGSGLTSLVCAHIAANWSKEGGNIDIVATDVAATVETTLAENLEANASPLCAPIHPIELVWGPVSSARRRELLRISDDDDQDEEDTSLLIVGADILYNPSSHAELLETVLSLLGTKRDCALIAYKARTEGDGDFFELARGKSLDVARVWEWGDVAIWSFRKL